MSKNSSILGGFLKLFQRVVPKPESTIERPNYGFYISTVLAVFGLGAILIFSASVGQNFVAAARLLAILSLIAGSSFSVGAISGFIFGVPKVLQSGETAAGTGNAQPGDGKLKQIPNTNLEQISDWLTKIIVGVGLTQMKEIGAGFDSLTLSLAQTFVTTKPETSAPFVGTIVILFLIVGFLISYLWTRLFLADIQANNIEQKVSQMMEGADKGNKEALSVTHNQLNLPLGAPDTSDEVLLEAYRKATGNNVGLIFYRAVTVRQENWEKNKAKMERTIPIFRALIKLDGNLEFPENYAQLGYALKDKDVPDYPEAEKNLSMAVKGFMKKGDTRGIGILLFNRAYCLIQLDANFKADKPTVDPTLKTIKDDLSRAAAEDYVRAIITRDPVTQKWIQVNNVTI